MLFLEKWSWARIFPRLRFSVVMKFNCVIINRRLNCWRSWWASPAAWMAQSHLYLNIHTGLLISRLWSEILTPSVRWRSAWCWQLILAASALIWPHVPPFSKTSDVLRGSRPRDSGRVWQVRAWMRYIKCSSRCLCVWKRWYLVSGMGSGLKSSAGVSTPPFTRASTFECDHPGEPGQLHL